MAESKDKTTKLDLTVDHNINGVEYKAGKGVEVRSEHVQALKENDAAYADATAYASTHHGAVPAPAYPQEATAQTPTRPLSGPEIRQAVTTVATPTTGDMQVVDDKGQTKVVEDKAAAIEENKQIEEGKTFDDEGDQASK
jgi:hypothetical protein